MGWLEQFQKRRLYDKCSDAETLEEEEDEEPLSDKLCYNKVKNKEDDLATYNSVSYC